MHLDRKIARMVAAMILAVIAYAAPSAARAHEGHAHRGAGAVVQGRPAPAVARTSGQDQVTPGLARRGTSVLPAPHAGARAALRAGEAGRCCGTCDTACCGTMAGCASAAGILAGAATLPPPPHGIVRPAPPVADGRADAWPEALPEPPRTRVS